MRRNFLGNLAAGIQKRFKTLLESPKGELSLNWLTTKYYKHLPAGKIRKRSLFGKTLYFSSPGELLHGFHEIFTEQIYKQSLPDRSYIIDCGANIGLSVIYMKRLCPTAQILAFEPDERNFSLLMKNIGSFGLKDVDIRREAVWKENTVLHFSDEGAMASKIESSQTEQSREITGIRLKDLLTRSVDFLKIDIEGAEFEVMKDISSSLHFVKNLFIEYHGSFGKTSELSELLGLISSHQFEYYIKEAAPVYETPFYRPPGKSVPYDVQLNLFCFRLP
ncbi:MAG: FkbM family methyltransferase [Bacteroidota bacterium]|nr:FkbM family methyltransferase [Bacteroidota bacterium]MDP4217576.1 FkbM family methyltransferase [Bacteroidota bacterium]MDP4245001.1 FkbM family methyltransferase [Bacteroidota bacterium]MDP4252893.1 FkbM family methyltransferase [Bacteroidota bacterium]MDP4259118.1 FkbM family methyltransferase [Bacteroidota bacterium]